ncbi:MAG: YgiT-type zinc finger protein [Candidatus Wallbacteria bacterium]|nr:YgiT-type zinc finger protein [Candidatus Wallbacteria bacterium]
MIPFKKCPVCKGEVMEKEVEKLLRGGKNTAIVRVKAEVCLHCGEKLFPEETIRNFELIRSKLEKEDTKDFKLIGNSFQIV